MNKKYIVIIIALLLSGYGLIISTSNHDLFLYINSSIIFTFTVFSYIGIEVNKIANENNGEKRCV